MLTAETADRVRPIPQDLEKVACFAFDSRTARRARVLQGAGGNKTGG